MLTVLIGLGVIAAVLNGYPAYYRWRAARASDDERFVMKAEASLEGAGGGSIVFLRGAIEWRAKRAPESRVIPASGVRLAVTNSLRFASFTRLRLDLASGEVLRFNVTAPARLVEAALAA